MGSAISCAEIADGRGGTISLDGFTRTYRRYYRVITDSATVGALQVISTNLGPNNRIPLAGEYYLAGGVADFGAIAKTATARQPDAESDPTHWIVEVEYSSRSPNPSIQQSGGGGGGGGGSPSEPQSTNPLFEKPRVIWGTKKILQTVTTDLDGRAIVNSASDPFETQQVEIAMRTLKITRNEKVSAFKPFVALSYIGKLNSRDFQGRPAGTCICDDYTAQDAYSNGIPYVVCTYDFSFAPDDKKGNPDTNFFKLNLVDKGHNYYEEPSNPATQSTSPPKAYHATMGLPSIVYLDGRGPDGIETLNIGRLLKFKSGPATGRIAFDVATGRLWPGGIHPSVGVNQPAAEVEVLRFRVRGTKDFLLLNLPDPA